MRPSISLLCIIALTGQAIAKDAITMHVVPFVSSEEKLGIEFHLKYSGATKLTVEVSNLPGVQRLSTVYVDVQRTYDNNAEPFEICPSPTATMVIDDPGIGSRTVVAGQEFVEKVYLNDSVSNLSQIMGKCDVIAFWEYKLYADSANGPIDFPRMAGAVVFRRDLSFNVPPDVSVAGRPLAKGNGR